VIPRHRVAAAVMNVQPPAAMTARGEALQQRRSLSPLLPIHAALAACWNRAAPGWLRMWPSQRSLDDGRQ
jgi:hypothetical protein